MKTIQSFTIDHDILGKGMYTSRVDGDAVTYDIRMKVPNNPENDYLVPAAARPEPAHAPLPVVPTVLASLRRRPVVVVRVDALERGANP